MTGPSSKRPRRRREEEEQCRCGKRKKHLYLALYERKECGFLGLSIHKLDADNDLEDHADALPEPVLRFAAPERAPMDLTAVGTSIFVATSPHLTRWDAPAPPLPTLVYDTETGALTVGPRLPDGYLSGLPAAVGGERLYALTRVSRVSDDDDDNAGELRNSSVSLRVLSRTRTASSWFPSETIMAWSWNWTGGHSSPPQPPPSLGRDATSLTSYAVHPDGRTIFMSTPRFTWSFDTGGKGVWKELGPWSLPFDGQAYFDGDLDAWVGLHREKKGYVCCCRVPSRSAAAATATTPECKMLREKMFLPSDDDSIRQRQKVTLTYMGDSRFCLVESVPNSRKYIDATLYVTLFGLRYDRSGELCTKVRRTTRSYALSFSNAMFRHAAFWM